VVSRSEDRLDRLWLDLRECLLEGGAHEDQLGAMRAAFMCGAHAAVVALATGRHAVGGRSSSAT
jgi:hypothetical protein